MGGNMSQCRYLDAAAAGQVDIVSLLKKMHRRCFEERDYNPDKLILPGFAAIHYGIIKQQAAVVELLLVSEYHQRTACTVTMPAPWVGEEARIPIAEGSTILHLACLMGSASMIKMITREGSDLIGIRNSLHQFAIDLLPFNTNLEGQIAALEGTPLLEELKFKLHPSEEQLMPNFIQNVALFGRGDLADYLSQKCRFSFSLKQQLGALCAGNYNSSSLIQLAMADIDVKLTGANYKQRHDCVEQLRSLQDFLVHGEVAVEQRLPTPQLDMFRTRMGIAAQNNNYAREQVNNTFQRKETKRIDQVQGIWSQKPVGKLNDSGSVLLNSSTVKNSVASAVSAGTRPVMNYIV